MADCDILAPVALENSITKENAENISVTVILELVNGPVTREADLILTKKNIIVNPGVPANAVGVTVSYFKWL